MFKCGKLGLFFYFDLQEETKEKQDGMHIAAEVHHPKQRKNKCWRKQREIEKGKN